MKARIRPSLLLVALAVPCVAAAAGSSTPEVTFNGQVGPILHERCGACHRPGQAAPFSLLTYEDSFKRAALIRAVTQSRYMPPWHAEPGYGEFKDVRSMLDSEIELVARWVESGAPEGEGPAPSPPEFSSGWTLGEPDLILRMREPFTIPEDGPDIYRNFPVAIPTTEDKWVRAVDFRPEAKTVVHHSLFKADPSRRVLELDAADDIPGFKGMGDAQITGRVNLGGWAVGANAKRFPPDAPVRLPAESAFVFQSHFHPSGKQEVETSTVALYFSDRPASRSRISISLPPRFGAGAGIDVPPGSTDFTISESLELPAAVELYAVTPHAHYIGKEFKAWAELPGGGKVPLIWIRDWDFAWQDQYVYREPVVLPAGAVLHARIRYDNSADNPRNPSNPPKRVLWGRESEDEMGSVGFSALPVNESDAASLREAVRELNAKHTRMARAYFIENRQAFAERRRSRAR